MEKIRIPSSLDCYSVSSFYTNRYNMVDLFFYIKYVVAWNYVDTCILMCSIVYSIYVLIQVLCKYVKLNY